MDAMVQMFTSTTWFDKYKKGDVAWGVSEEGRAEYSYMMMPVYIPASEVIGMEQKTIGEGVDQRVFLSYDIQKRRFDGLGD